MTKSKTTLQVMTLTGLVGYAALSYAAEQPGKKDLKPAASASTAAVAGRSIVSIAAYPKKIQLTHSNDEQTFIVQGAYADGLTEDLTAQAKIEIADPKLVKRSGNALLPIADGSTELTISYAGKSLRVPVEIKESKSARPVSFRLDVMPVFTKAGCSTGDCHGAARGKDGFQISLFGYDPAGDYQKITRQMAGRRINLGAPAESLLLTKSVGAVQHTGGERFKVGSDLHNTVLQWLEAGAPDDSAEVAKVVGIDLYPPSAVLDGQGAAQGFTVLAKYSDGSDRDVTRLAKFITNNEGTASVVDGQVKAGVRGEAFIMARFDAFTVGSPVIVLPKGLKYEWPKNIVENNYIDTLVNAKLKKLRIIPSELCSDEQFLRRACIDITGQLPDRDEFEKFTADKDPRKREKLVDKLLDQKEFVDIWVMKFAELLQIRSDNNINRGISYKAALLYYDWLGDQLAHNVPMDQVIQKMIGANGSNFSNPATNFYQTERDNLKLAENVAQVFMGFRLQCAQCHNHPFDRWTMDDYYGWVSFFTSVGRKRAEDPRDQIIYDRGGEGGARNPVGNREMKPKFLGGDVPDIKGKDRRRVLAEWLASPRNPFFARNLSNIVWQHFMGRGIIEPVDDVRVSNPAANPELLDELGSKFTAYKYDFRKLVRDICTSRTYQLSTHTNPTNELDATNFSHAYIRRIRAEVLYDVISQVTETASQNKFKSLPKGARAVEIADGKTSSYFLTTFGRATRDTPCSCEVKMDPNLSQALHLLNGDTVNAKLASGDVIGKMLKDKLHPMAIVEELFIRCVGRRPTDIELDRIADQLKQDEKLTPQVMQDVFWALLNSKEFLFNH